MHSVKQTPMMQHYLSVKEAYPDALLFYRMGDFYEMFFEDAEKASRILEIALTSRNKNDASPIPMCGVPVRAAKSYIARLIENGFKVAVCDQVEDPAAAKGLVKREVVRVVTPGMLVEEELLDGKSDNFVLAVHWSGDVFGIAHLDISTGLFRVAEHPEPTVILDESMRVAPREIVLPEFFQHHPDAELLRKRFAESAVSFLEDRVFDFRQGRRRLMEQFKTLSLEGFGCEHLKSGVGAAGALLFYVEDTQKQPLAHVNGIETYHLDDFLIIDDVSCRNLELLRNLRTGSRQGTLLNVLDQTVTAMGGRLLQRWLRYPLRDIEDIRKRLSAVAEAKADLLTRSSVRESLKKVYDLERLGGKIVMGHCTPGDMLALKVSLQALPGILQTLAGLQNESYRFAPSCDDLVQLAELLEKALRPDAPPTLQEGGLIRCGYDPALDELIEISRNGKNVIAGMERQQREATGINTLKVRYNKVFGYYIEVPKSQVPSVPDGYVRKQTLTNAERYITEDLKAFEEKVLGAEEKRAKLEYEIFCRLRDEICRHQVLLQAAARFLATVDALMNLAEIADRNRYVEPVFNADGVVQIEDGRHPVIEKMLAAERFVPNSVLLDDTQNQVLIITGPNMAGKSTVLRQVALTVVMAQMGSFVPARQARLSLVDRIFTRVGALDDLSQGQSTFMVEMQETANILNNATPDSLVIMDEVGRGTSTFDGLSIAWAVAEHLHNLHGRGVKTLFATHYHELTLLAEALPRIQNFHIAVKEWNDEIVFLHKLAPGGTNRSYGIQVSRLAGIPAAVILRAKKLLSHLERSEYGLTSLNVLSADGVDEKKQPKQLELFPPPEQFVIEELQNLDITQITPLEALNFLSLLQERVRQGAAP